MPIFDYVCEDCLIEFDKLVKHNEEPPNCPEWLSSDVIKKEVQVINFELKVLVYIKMERIKQMYIKSRLQHYSIRCRNICSFKVTDNEIFISYVLQVHAILIYDFTTTHKNKPLIIQNIYFFIVNMICNLYSVMIK
jgi:hypothetical protein